MRKQIGLILLLLLLWSGSSYANAAPPVWEGEFGGIVFAETSGVSLERAQIRYSISEERIDLATVHVTYELENLRASDRDLSLYFMHATNPENFIVSLDGRVVTTEPPRSGRHLIENWTVDERIFFYDPIDDRRLDEAVENALGSPTAVPFSVSLAAGQKHRLEIQFIARAAFYNREDVINRISAQVYYLSPASFFEGQTATELIVEVPEDLALESSIPLKAVSKTLYEGRFDRLPADTWVLSYARKSGLPFGINRRGTNNLIVGFLFAGLLVSLLVLRKKSKHAWWFLLPLVMSLGLYRPSYGTVFLIVIFGPMVLIGILFVFLIRWILLRQRKKKAGE